MKKIILAASLAVSIFALNAQNVPFSAGTISVGGNIGIQVGSSSTKAAGTTVDGPSTFAFAILPNVQYFLSDKLSLGVQVGFKSESSTTKAIGATPESSTSTNTSSFSPYARYYQFIGDEGKFAFFGQGSVSIATQSGTSKSGGTSVDEPNTFIFGVGASPGIIFFPTKRIGLEAIIGNVIALQTSTTTTKVTGTSDTVESKTTFDLLNVNTLAFQFGFNYYFGN